MRSELKNIIHWMVLGGVALLAGLSCVAADHEIIFEPWPYGLIAYVDVDPGDYVQSDSTRLVSAVERICGFWGLPAPQSNPAWETALQGTRKTSAAGWSSQLARLPENASGNTRWWRCKSFWADTLLYECIIAVYSDHEALAMAAEYYGSRAFFTGRSVDGLPGPVVVLTERDFREREDILVHELTHWLCGAMYGEGLLASRIPILKEGVACVTHREVGREGRPSNAWAMAALYAQEGDLADAPRWLRHSLGETVVDILLETGIPPIGEASWQCAASSLCRVWHDLAARIDEAWTEAVDEVPSASEAERAIYKARSQSLYLARDLLDPILSDEAKAAYEEIFDDQATEASVDRFWELASNTPLFSSLYSEMPWTAMEWREPTLVRTLVSQTLHAAPPAPESAQYDWMDAPDGEAASAHIARLVGLRELKLWGRYVDEYLMLVKTIVRDGLVDPDLIPWWDPEDEA